MLKNVDVVTIGGIVRNTSVRIENGKISAISDALTAADEEFDLNGATLYPGLSTSTFTARPVSTQIPRVLKI